MKKDVIKSIKNLFGGDGDKIRLPSGLYRVVELNTRDAYYRYRAYPHPSTIRITPSSTMALLLTGDRAGWCQGRGERAEIGELDGHTVTFYAAKLERIA